MSVCEKYYFHIFGKKLRDLHNSKETVSKRRVITNKEMKTLQVEIDKYRGIKDKNKSTNLMYRRKYS
ncbi:hypothetical protein KUTeg_014849, partial [Tegillarca granosa]